MYRKCSYLICVALAISIGSAVWTSEANAWSGSALLFKGSLNANNNIAGGGNQTVIDGTSYTEVFLKELGWRCVNKKGNADPAEGQPFKLSDARFEVASQKDWSCKRNGQCPFPFVITDEELDQLIFQKFGVHLSAAELCPNRNWQLNWAVTRFDGTFVVSKADEDALIYYQVGPRPGQPAGTTCLGNPSVDANGNPVNRDKCYDKYQSCAVEISGIAYHIPQYDSNGALTGYLPATGQIDECIVFRDTPSLGNLWAATTDFPHADTGGCRYPRADLKGSDFYECACLDHGHEVGNPLRWGPTGPSATDLECLIGPTLVDGVY